MRVRKKFLLLFLVFSVFHFGNASNLQSNGKNENSQTVVTNLGNYLKPSNTSHIKRTFDSNVEKIKHGLFVEDHPLFEPMPSIEEQFQKEKVQRQLAEGTLIEKAGFFEFKQEKTAQTFYAYKHVLANLKKSSSKFISYPFSFDYTDKDAVAHHYAQGGIFTLRPDLLPGQSDYNYFKYLNETTNVVLGKSKALYDINVAIFKLEDELEGNKVDLFFDSDNYCSFFVNYIGKVPSCLYGKNEFITYRNKNPNKGVVAFFNHTELLNNSLFNDDGSNAFSLLIIPDHIAGSEDLIIERFTETGVEMIKNYVDNGGQILVGGKSGYILEKIGLVPEGSYDTSHFLMSKASSSIISLKGCENAAGASSNSAEYLNQLMCMNNQGKSYLSTSYPMKSHTGYTNILSVDVTSEGLTYKSDEGDYVDLEADATDFPFLLYKQKNKGKIFILNGNPLYKSDYTSLVFNILFSAMSKNVIFNSYINFGEEGSDLPIPGGEAGILLEAVIEFLNLYNKPVNDFKMYLYVPVNVSFTNYDSTCQLSNEIIPEHENITSMNLKQHLECNLAQLAGFNTFKQIIKLEILDQGVTQKATDIPLMYPIIKFTEEETGLETTLDDGAVKVEAALAAVLRGAINPDPSSFYPLPGRGAFADTVLKVENKENTLAFEVDYISVIPLISPIVDGNDQGSPIELCEIYHQYYENNGYIFPWNITGEHKDYIDYQELSGKSVVMVAEWDTPVKIGKFLRSEIFENKPDLVDELDLVNGNQSTVITNTQTVLQQLYFKDSDLFYEHATQRTMPFINPTNEKGAQALYEGNIPEHLKDLDHPTQSRRLIPWSRVDIFFYPAQEYQQPIGIDDSVVFSVDKYPKPTPGTADVLGKEKCGKFKGYFDSTKSPAIMPDEFENLMLKYKFHKQYDPTNPADLAEINQKSNNSIELTHYLMPVKDKTIRRAGNIVNFTETENFEGYLENYTSVKFIYAHKIPVVVSPEISRQGGKLVLYLGSEEFDSTDPVKDELITVSADQVAFNETRYDATKNVITMFFKRGLMPNEAYGKDSVLEIDLEKIKKKENFTLKIELYEMKYDITNKEANYENYKKVDSFPADYTAEYACFFSLPALVIHNYMNRNNNDTIREYELLNPYTRYGIYFQELYAHRTIWGSSEAHHVTNPGLQAINGGFSVISNIGISSIPFVEYVTHGSGLLIPSAVSTSRIEWRDIWGRKWSQPLRSVFPDIPPIPPPLRNFMMSTTYELLTPDGKERMLEWPSDEEAVIRVQMKFVNNYPKFFMPTICPNNNHPFMKTGASNQGSMFYDTPQYPRFEEEGENYHVFFGHTSVYGKCYQDNKAYLGGRPITPAISDEMTNAMLCAATNDGQKIKECADRLKQLNLPTMNRREGEGTQTWNYSPKVENYYPEGYIKENMWDLTHYDYDDNSMDKGYKYHMDNNLPAIDIGSTAVSKPHNVVSYPIFKGFGYQISYSSDFTLPQFAPYHGWWSDNLQNKDDTLLAGQAKSNDISVDKESLLGPNDWVDAKDLINTINKNLPQSRLKTIYACMFNRNRVRYKYNQSRYSFPHNVYQNNVIPIINELDADAPEYTKFNCSNVPYQYSPVNISDIDNRIETPTDRDYLYFGINLRGGAKETINVLMTLKPFEDRKYEGTTKVQDGGRFTYWNPANGPNSFLIVDNNVNTVEAYRVDFEVTSTFYPGYLTTFNSVGYQIHKVSDPNEKERQWSMTTYMNSYGFGDSAVTVYVGGTQDTNCKLEPGELTYIKVAFYNNAGFDWNLYKAAIDFEERGEAAINGNDLLMGEVHTIKAPLKYNFMKLNIPKEIEPYITIQASDHNIDVAPEFFDFQNINVATIRDSFEGDYFYNLTIHNDFPDEYKGRLIEIGIDLVYEMFDHLPGYNDPTNIHDYKLKIPPIKFGVKYPSTSPYAGKVFYTLGRGTDIKVQYQLSKEFDVEEVRYLSEEEIINFSTASSHTDTYAQDLLAEWNALTSESIDFTVTPIDNTNFNLISVDVSKKYPTLPLEKLGEPDITEFYIISKANAAQIEYGYQAVLTKAQVEFTTPRNKTKICQVDEPSNRYTSVKGPWASISAANTVVTKDENGNYVVAEDQSVYVTDSGTLKLDMTVKNTGGATAFNTSYAVTLAPDVTVDEDSIQSNYEMTTGENGETVILLNTNQDIASGEKFRQTLYVDFDAISNMTLRNLGESGSRTIIKSVSVSIQQTASDVSSTVQQQVPINYQLKYRTIERPKVSLTFEQQGTFLEPKYKIIAAVDSLTTSNPINIGLFRKVDSSVLNEWVEIQQPSTNMEIIDSPLTSAETANLKEYTTLYRADLYDGTTFISSTLYQVQETLDEQKINEKGSGKKFPIWAIIVIVILGLLLLTLIGVAVYKFITHKAAATQLPVEVVQNERAIAEKPIATNGERSSRSQAPMIKGEEIRVNRYVPNPILEMSEL